MSLLQSPYFDIDFTAVPLTFITEPVDYYWFDCLAADRPVAMPSDHVFQID